VLDHLKRLLDYNAWANREALSVLRGLPQPPPRALRFLGHVAGAEELWLSRLRGQPPGHAVWPELTLLQCEESVEALARAWSEHLGTLPEEGLERPVSYVNSKGEPWTSTVADIVTHVVIHSAYHRGQVASEMRSSGHTPAYTDFIHCVRQGLLE
jgi:uncharacterized damage-inducible protein DinB